MEKSNSIFPSTDKKNSFRIFAWPGKSSTYVLKPHFIDIDHLSFLMFKMSKCGCDNEYMNIIFVLYNIFRICETITCLNLICIMKMYEYK